MQIDDQYHILDQFNEACKDAADVASRTFTHEEFEIKLAMTIPDIDDWWTIQIDGKDIKTRYIEFIASFNDTDRQKFLDQGRQEIAKFPDYEAHFRAARSTAMEPLTIDMHYLPHFVEYMNDVFEQFEGYNVLQRTLENEGMSGRLCMRLVNEDHSDFMDKGNLHGLCNYRMVLLAKTNPIPPTQSIRFTN